ncbi:hypothetical protein LTR37_000272 [Vermiconidia calcicola]|uniref:Uncharacterized protein n=1 Tax=Vermiconidia calcicola TaxID=1690605 RepID=A0ACC3P012_9PEZI|nr:hypothetical protein LTR37_000272 [Vermiconidia calcicola]
MDSTQNPPTKMLSLPSGMLFSKQLKVTDVQQVNHDTKRITFALPGGKNEVSGLTPGAAILTQHTPAGAWLPVLRPYTPIHNLDQPGILELLVKKYPEGRASTHMHSLSPGDELTVRGPLPGAWTTPKDQREIVLIAGGAGITPIYSLAKGILFNPEDKTKIQLLWGVNGTRDIVLNQELEALEKQYPERLQVTYAVSGPEASPSAASLGDESKYRKGYVDKSLLQEVIQKCQKSGAWGDAKAQNVFLCGPPKMEDAIAGKNGALTQLGVQKKEVYRF